MRRSWIFESSLWCMGRVCLCSGGVVAVDVSLHELCCGGEVFDRGAVCAGGGSQTAWGGCGGGEFSHAAAQYAVLDTGEELRGVQAVVGDEVAVGALDAGDQIAGFQSAQVVGHLAGGDGAGVKSANLGGVGAQVFVGEAVWLAAEHE